MKKSSAQSSKPRFWRGIALLSVAVNAGLLLGIWKQKMSLPDGAEPAAAAVDAATVTPRLQGPHAALGSYFAETNGLAGLGWTEAQFTEFLAGMRAGFEGRGLPLNDDAKKLRDEIDDRKRAGAPGQQPDSVQGYFRLLRENEGARETASGLHYRITEAGSGPHPQADDTVVVSYSIQQRDGTEVAELSRARVRLLVKELVPGVAEAVQLLSAGGKALVFVPASLSFEEAEWPQQVPKGMPLTFSVELHEIVQPTPP